MSEEESGADDDSLRSVIEERMRERLPTLQSAIQSKTGKKISESELEEILSGEMSGIVAEVTILASSAYSGPLPIPPPRCRGTFSARATSPRRAYAAGSITGKC